MEQFESALIAYIVSWLTATAGVWFLFEKGEEVASKETKDSITSWLLSHKTNPPKINFISSFFNIFEGLFGFKAFTVKFFIRSCLTSLVAIVSITAFWMYLRPSEFHNYMIKYNYGIHTIIWPFLIPTLSNFIIDYLSITETKFVIRSFRNQPSALKFLFLITIDFLATLLLAITSIILALLVLIACVTVLQQDKEVITQTVFILNWGMSLLFKEGVALTNHGTGPYPIGIWFYSTFATSLWIWTYAIAAILGRIISHTTRATSLGLKFVDIENKPIRSLGFIAMLAFSCLFFLIPVIASMF